MASIPSGWTDDMNIALASHHTLDAVVDLVISSGRAHTPVATTQRALIETFGLTDGDAALAWDRSTAASSEQQPAMSRTAQTSRRILSRGPAFSWPRKIEPSLLRSTRSTQIQRERCRIPSVSRGGASGVEVMLFTVHEL